LCGNVMHTPEVGAGPEVAALQIRIGEAVWLLIIFALALAQLRVGA
jgi:hypothetical protein